MNDLNKYIEIAKNLYPDFEENVADYWPIIFHFGWGSCSGCDALCACNSYEHLADLIMNLEQEIQEFESFISFKDWVQNKKTIDYYDNTLGWKAFKAAVLNY